jgi:hypothetical protein
VSNDPNVRQVAGAPPLDPDVRVVEATPTVPYVQPVPNQVVVAQPVVAQPVQRVVVAQPVRPARRWIATTRSFSQIWDSIIVGVVGTVLLLIGLIAFVRAGTDGPWNQPVVEVLGFTHTATLGIIEMAFGLLLLLSAVTLSRGAATFFGALLAIGGFVGAVQTESFAKSLALESSLAWWMVIAGLLVVIVSAIVPRVIVTRTTTYTAADPYLR